MTNPMTLVIDVGSGASLPDSVTARRFVDAIKGVDTGKHKIVLKAQLFASVPPNIPLGYEVFHELYTYGEAAGYGVTASVFDVASLRHLLTYVVPFVKIACRPVLYWLAGEVPRKVRVYRSIRRGHAATPFPEPHSEYEIRDLLCIPEYPADAKDYDREVRSARDHSLAGISDHTVGWDLFRAQTREHRGRRHGVALWEKHFILPDTTGPDVGPWACTPETLKEIM